MASTPLQLPGHCLACPTHLCSLLGLQEEPEVLQTQEPVASLLAGQAGAAVVEDMGEVVRGVERLLLLCLWEEEEEEEERVDWLTLRLARAKGGVRLSLEGESLGQGALSNVVARDLLPLAYRRAPQLVVIR